MARYNTMAMRSFVVLLILLLAGCSPCKELRSTSLRDSVSVNLRERTVTIRDTIFVDIPQSSQQVTTPSDSSFLSNEFARSEAIILPSGELHHTLDIVPQSISKENEVSVEVRDSIIYRTRNEVKIVEVERELTWWQEFQIKSFRILALILIGGIAVRQLL